MGIPVTSGSFQTDIQNMAIGDYIACKYTATSGSVGTFSNLGDALATAQANEISTSGSATPSGYFYFLKADKGLLIADRVVQTSISWDTLNTGKYIEGKITTLGSNNVLIRSLSGGSAFADANGYSSSTDQSKGGFPTNNEWDKYIVNSTLNGKITSGDDAVWHYSNSLPSLCKDTIVTAIGTNTRRTTRGGTTKYSFANQLTSSVSVSTCFRPVIEILESGALASNFYY